MSYIYVLQSPDGSDIYIGFSNNLKRRMAEHERSAHPGWRLVYYEAYQSEGDARRRGTSSEGSRQCRKTTRAANQRFLERILVAKMVRGRSEMGQPTV